MVYRTLRRGRLVSLPATYFPLNMTIKIISFFLKILFIRLTERDTAREGTQAGGVGKASRQAESPMWDSIPGPWDHDLS